MPEAYERLAEAIIVLACNDYRDELFWLEMHKPLIPEDAEESKYVEHKAEANSIETFFRSWWFQTLTPLDGEEIMERIRKEIIHDDE